MKGNYIDLARYLDKVQKGCRVRLITFDDLRVLIQLVEGGSQDRSINKYAAVDGGKIAPESCYPGQTTLALVAKNFNNEIVVGIQRCAALPGTPWGVHNPTDINRGSWQLVSRELDVKEWADYWGPQQRFILETTGMTV